jgi:hypothetical protein
MSDDKPFSASGELISFEKAAEELRARREGPIFQEKLRSGMPCWHLSIVVDGNARTVECAKCGALLDPLEALLKFAREEINLGYRLQQLRDDCNKVAAKLDDTKRQERNARARLKRLQEKLNAIEDEFTGGGGCV